MLLKTIIVEDEPLSRAFLNNLLAEFCPGVVVAATVPTENEAIDAIERLQPDLVFLDIELQQGTGFEVLKKTHQQDYQVIFTTAFDHSGIKAIKFSGVDYLQKPIDIEGLQSSITGIIAKQHTSAGKIAIQHLLYTLDNNNVPAQLVVQTEEGQEYIPVDAIIYIEASDNTCIFNTDIGRIASTGRNIQEYEHLLAEYNFYRLHHAYIVNTRKVVESSKPDSGFIRMTNESTIPVSAKRSGELNSILSANG